MFIFILKVFFIIYVIQIVILFFPICLYYCLYFWRLTLVLLLLVFPSVLLPVLPANLSQGGSLKEHLNLNVNLYVIMTITIKQIPGKYRAQWLNHQVGHRVLHLIQTRSLMKLWCSNRIEKPLHHCMCYTEIHLMQCYVHLLHQSLVMGGPWISIF